jgi:hypothetical protein
VVADGGANDQIKTMEVPQSSEIDLERGDTLMNAIVQLCDLKTTALNDLCGRVLDFDAGSNRYAVELPDGRKIRVKKINLRTQQESREPATVHRDECNLLACQFIDYVATDLFTDGDDIGPPEMTRLLQECSLSLRTALKLVHKEREENKSATPPN